MTKKLEDLFDMLQNEQTPTEPEEVIEVAEEAPVEPSPTEVVERVAELPDHIQARIDAALPQVTGLNDDTNMDTLIQSAIDAHKNLIDLGMQVEAAFAGKILDAAGQVLKHAIDAQHYKNDRKIRMIELQLKKARLDLQERAVESKLNPNGPIQSSATLIDRNELIKRLQNNEQTNK